MYKTTGLKNSRIEVADALRGLAVAGIILFHSVEHFSKTAKNDPFGYIWLHLAKRKSGQFSSPKTTP